MKTKIDFVSNSSSASFIMYIESTVNNIDDFKNDMQKFIDDYFKEYLWKFKLQDDNEKQNYEKWIEEAKDEKTKKYYSDSLEKFINNNTSRETVLKNRLLDAISQVSTNVFSIEDFTGMLNDLTDDVPHYMRYLIMLYITDDSIKYGIKGIKLKIVDNH